MVLQQHRALGRELSGHCVVSFRGNVRILLPVVFRNHRIVLEQPDCKHRKQHSVNLVIQYCLAHIPAQHCVFQLRGKHASWPTREFLVETAESGGDCRVCGAVVGANSVFISSVAFQFNVLRLVILAGPAAVDQVVCSCRAMCQPQPIHVHAKNDRVCTRNIERQRRGKQSWEYPLLDAHEHMIDIAPASTAA